MSTPSFRFKQFTVWHDRCAMKVGTDGVLLGAWCPVETALSTASCRVLDIGTGSGLIALMLAQRLIGSSPCTMHDGTSEYNGEGFHIDAIDIDPAAVEQATVNFSQSPWSNRLTASQCSLQTWHGQYDLMVSNPPYFTDSLKNPDAERAIARHTDWLSYEDLIKHSARLLAENGCLALILPAEAENSIRTLAMAHGLHPTHITRVYSKPSHPAPKRVLIVFRKSNNPVRERSVIEDTLYIESAHSPRSEEYAEMTKEFYL